MALDCADTDSTAGDYAQALAKYDELLTQTRGPGVHPSMEVIATKYRATTLTSMGRRGEGLREMERALEMAQARFGAGSEHAQDVSIRLCSAYITNSRLDEAIELCGRVSAQRAQAAPGDFTRAYANRFWADSLVKRNRSPEDIKHGIELLESSIREFELKYGKTSSHALQSRRARAYALLRDKQYEPAEQEVLAVRGEFARIHGERHPDTVTSDELLQVILIEQRKYQEAAALQKDKLQDNKARDPISRLNRDLTHAVNLVNTRRNDEALEALKAWAAGVESVRDQVALDPVSKAQFAQQWHSGYQLLAVAYYRKQMHRAALVSLELSKARALLASMEEMEALRALPPEQRTEALALMREASLQRQRQRLAGAGSAQALEASRVAANLEQQFGQLIDRESVARLRGRVSREQVDWHIAALTAETQEHEAYLSLGYGIGGRQTVMPMLLRRGRVHIPARPLVIEGNLESSVRAMRMLAQHGADGMRKRDLKIIAKLPEGFEAVPDSEPEPAIENPRMVVEYLSEKLLGPFKEQLKGVSHLVVSADGPTWLIPFDLLEVDGQPLFKTVKVSFTPSVSVLRLQRERMAANTSTVASGRLLAVGGAHYQRQVQLIRGSPIFMDRVKASATPSSYDTAALASATSAAEFFSHLKTMKVGAKDLPGSLKEVRSISQRFAPSNVTMLVEQDATEKRINALVRGNQMAGYDYIHFATHGIAQSRRPLMSALLTGVEDRDGEHDGYISAQEITAWNLKAKLVVLSACDSALGASIGGEGILGLPYAFLMAGAAATIQTLWAVPDAGAAEWMDLLYERLAAGETPSDALAHVKRKVAANHRWEPRYEGPTPWAAFALYGQ